jgi:hypothetical protein
MVAVIARFDRSASRRVTRWQPGILPRALSWAECQDARVPGGYARARGRAGSPRELALCHSAQLRLQLMLGILPGTLAARWHSAWQRCHLHYPDRKVYPAMTESELLKTVTARCDERGLYWFHNFGWRTGRKAGWPDLVIVAHGMLFRELKSESASVSGDQSACGRLIRAAGGNWAVWRPADLTSGRVDRELDELAACPINADRDTQSQEDTADVVSIV